ncbi:MAG TPA: hypothetical protein VF973_05855 [Myxococcales bacterium]
MIELVQSVLSRRAALKEGIARGYAAALERQPLRPGPEIRAELPAGMLEALTIAGVLRGNAADRHYLEAMPGQLAAQLRGRGGPEERLFSARLDLRWLPRLRHGLERLFALVSDAGIACRPALGAATPRDLVVARPTLGHLYASCHFGRSMPMLYAYPGDLAEDAWRGRGPEELIDARYVGPILHELSHLHALDPDLVPAPANVHEALAAWIGSEAWEEQAFPAPGGEDAIPGAPWFAAVGGFLALRIGAREAIRAQAGALDLRGPLGARCVEALRCYGWLGFLETGAPHFLADAFHPERWWKLIDLHRDPRLSQAFQVEYVEPLLHSVPAPGTPLRARWDAALDALAWPELPAWNDAPAGADDALALRAVRALHVRTEVAGRSFRTVRVRPPGTLALDVRECLLRAPWPAADAVGAPPRHPYPPSLCAASSRNRGTPALPPPD